AIERGHAMRTDGEIERLSEMPADSINLPPGKRGTSARPAAAALRLGYINHATGRKRAWQLLARLRHSKTADGLPLLGEERSSNGRRACEPRGRRPMVSSNSSGLSHRRLLLARR